MEHNLVYKVTTVSLNPAIDQTVWVDNLQINAVNRGRSIQLEPGGKGVNVALFLADYAHHTTNQWDLAVTGFLGRDNAHIFEQRFARQGIADHFIRVPGLTRTGVKLVDEAAQQTTDINMPGLEPSPEAVEQLFETLDSLAAQSGWFVLTGSLPPGLPANFYARIIELLRARGSKVILDTSQAALSEGVRACPTIVKPNQVELQDLTVSEISDQAGTLSAIRGLLDSGIEMVVVSQGERGALFASQEQVLQVIPPRLLVKSTVGAGDALVAGILSAQLRSLALPECARLATAFSLSAITSSSRGLPELSRINSLAELVRIENL